MKKTWLIISIFSMAGIMLLGIIYTILIFTNNLYLKKKVYISPDNKYKVVIKGNGPRWPFGSEDIKIYAYKNSFLGMFDKKVFKTMISNDGKSLNDSNFSITWDENKAYLTLIGEEQKNEYILIDFNDKISFKHKGLDYRIKDTDEIKVINTYSHNNYYLNKNLELYYKNVEFLFNGEYISIDEAFKQNIIDINDFIITMDYEAENKKAIRKWEKQGNASVYKNDKITLIICKYDRYNQDYKSQNENYLKYTIADSSLEYDYNLCKP